MQGLAAITAQNGWAMAATGACIVIAGLSILSFIISQLHRILGVFEKNGDADGTQTLEAKKPAALEHATLDLDPLADLAATARSYQPFTAQLGETFGLGQLYKALDAANIPHPHITVRELMAAGYLAPVEEGIFSWKNI